MYGAILGDIIGSPYEFNRGNKTKDFPLFSKESGYTDDTVMTLAVADAAQTVDAGQTLESHLLLTTQVTLDEDVVAGDCLHNLGQLSVGKRARAQIRRDTGLLKHLLSRGGPDAVDVAKGGLNALLIGYFDTEKTSQSGVCFLFVCSFAAFRQRF